MRNGSPFTLSTQNASFLGIEHLSILAASRGLDNIPSVARALGCRLSPDHRKVTLFLSSAEARELLDHIANNGVIAVVFSVPSTHEALQLKGSDAVVEKLTKTDFKLVALYRQAFVDHVEKLGYPATLIQALVDCESENLVGVTFTPSAAFSQTPGPNAGHALGTTK